VSSWFGIQLVSKARIGFAKKRKMGCHLLPEAKGPT
jgi:hypothetical protein